MTELATINDQFENLCVHQSRLITREANTYQLLLSFFKKKRQKVTLFRTRVLGNFKTGNFLGRTSYKVL